MTHIKIQALEWRLVPKVFQIEAIPKHKKLNLSQVSILSDWQRRDVIFVGLCMWSVLVSGEVF